MRLRLLLSFALVVLVTIVAVVFFARQNTVQEVNTYMLRGGMTGGEDLVSLLENYYANTGSWQGVDQLLFQHGQGVGSGANGMMGMMSQRLRVLDVGGFVVADSQSAQVGERVTQPDFQNAVQLNGPDGKIVGYLLAEGGVPGSQQPLIRRLNDASIKAGLLAGAIAIILAGILAYTLVRPVQQLTRAAEGMAQGDLSQRVPAKGNDELATLGRTFNQMASTLQQSQSARRAMTADIAHELRTPLAVQRAQLEALEDGIYPLSIENLQPIVEQNRLLERLVDDLRTLALADAGELALEKVPTNLADIAQKTITRFQAQASQKKISLAYSGPGEGECPRIAADPVRIEQVLNNLVANALRYTPEAGQIQLTLQCQPGGPVLSVQDSGSGIPQDALSHIFERFYRADRSRSRLDGGTGLGLAIARQLAEAHQGTLDVANAQQGGAVFTLRLPAASYL